MYKSLKYKYEHIFVICGYLELELLSKHLEQGYSLSIGVNLNFLLALRSQSSKHV